MTAKFSDIEMACEFVSSGGDFSESYAYVNRETGQVYWESDLIDDAPQEQPDNLEDEKWIAIPDKRDLELGKRLVLDFAWRHMPDHAEEVETIFRKRGAYRRYKELLHSIGMLEKWYKFESAAQEKALRKWCRESGVEVEG